VPFTKVFEIDESAYLYENYPSRNYGASTYLTVDRTTPGKEKTTLLHFDLQQLIDVYKDWGIIIHSATLNIKVNSCTVPDKSIGQTKLAVWRVLKQWEGGTGDGRHAKSGECTWNSARHNYPLLPLEMQLWDTPGCEEVGKDRNFYDEDHNIYDSTAAESLGGTWLKFGVRRAINYVLAHEENFGFVLDEYTSGGGEDHANWVLHKNDAPFLEIEFEASSSSSSSSSTSISSSSSSSRSSSSSSKSSSSSSRSSSSSSSSSSSRSSSSSSTSFSIHV